MSKIQLHQEILSYLVLYPVKEVKKIQWTQKNFGFTAHIKKILSLSIQNEEDIVTPKDIESLGLDFIFN